MRAIGLFLLSIAPFGLLAQSTDDSTKVIRDTTQVIFSITADDLDEDAQNQDVSTLLQSSRDVFANIAGYNFSNARFRTRGLQSEHYSVLINGVPMNDPEMGWAIFAYWGGLNDVTRYPESGYGLTSSNFNFSGLSGYSQMDLRPSTDRKGTRVSYALTNRTYRNRAMLTHSTGMMKNGWAFTVSGSFRWSNEGYVDGTFYNGGSYFFGAEKKINEKHSLAFTGFGAPTIQGRSGIALMEAMELTDNHYYNPYWGWQTDGDSGKQVKRNARIRDNHRPSVFLNHYWTIDKKQNLTTALYSTFGKTANSNLNWYDTKDPRPDYYRYLPSYNELQNPAIAAQQTIAWQTDQTVSQIDWDGLYNANYTNLYTMKNVDGIEGNNLEFVRSKYILEDYRVDPFQIGINSVYNRKLSDAMRLTAGLLVDRYKSHNYRVVKDLLGGDYWVDINQFAERDFSDPVASESNTETPNRLVKVGDMLGYNYNMFVNTERTFAQIKKLGEKFDWYGALSLSHTQFYREGLWQTGLFPENSKGIGEKHNYFNYGLKGGTVYKVTGRHYVTGNFQYETKAPFSRNVYISPTNRDGIVNGVKSSEAISGDISYVVRYPYLKARATAYYTEIKNQVWSKTYYHDEFRNFINYMMTGVDHVYSGIELGAEATVLTDWNITAAFATGEFLYNSRPKATVTSNNSQELLAEDRTVYLKNYHIGGMPQTAASFGIKYNSPKYWFAGVSFNWFTDIYLDPNPDRRTEESVAKYFTTDPQWNEILDETVIHNLDNNKFFENNYTLDAFAGVSYKIKDNNFIRFNVSANNLLNNTDFLTGGFEQLRFDSTNPGKFPPKYGYMYGTTFFAMLTYIF